MKIEPVWTLERVHALRSDSDGLRFAPALTRLLLGQEISYLERKAEKCRLWFHTPNWTENGVRPCQHSCKTSPLAIVGIYPLSLLERTDRRLDTTSPVGV